MQIISQISPASLEFSERPTLSPAVHHNAQAEAPQTPTILSHLDPRKQVSSNTNIMRDSLQDDTTSQFLTTKFTQNTPQPTLQLVSSATELEEGPRKVAMDAYDWRNVPRTGQVTTMAPTLPASYGPTEQSTLHKAARGAYFPYGNASNKQESLVTEVYTGAEVSTRVLATTMPGTNVQSGRHGHPTTMVAAFDHTSRNPDAPTHEKMPSQVTFQMQSSIATHEEMRSWSPERLQSAEEALKARLNELGGSTVHYEGFDLVSSQHTEEKAQSSMITNTNQTFGENDRAPRFAVMTRAEYTQQKPWRDLKAREYTFRPEPADRLDSLEDV